MSTAQPFAHRVAFNCDLIFDILTDSPETPLDELERLAKAKLVEVNGNPSACLADCGLDLPSLPGGRVYPRTEHVGLMGDTRCDQTERLEKFSSENCDSSTSQDKDMPLVSDATEQLKTQHLDCPCWKTGRFIWTSKCVDHPIQDPWAYGYDELPRIADDARRGIFPKTQRRGD
jgi:hypothetical protein